VELVLQVFRRPGQQQEGDVEEGKVTDGVEDQRPAGEKAKP
jgi:hypothetical protein